MEVSYNVNWELSVNVIRDLKMEKGSSAGKGAGASTQKKGLETER